MVNNRFLKNTLSKPHFFFALICIFNLIVYWPSLQHFPRGDQIGYLSQVSRHSDWHSLVIKNMDLNRGSNVYTGDTWLFRPLFYALLGMERFFFGYSFHLWQLVGILLHLLFLWALWKFLTSIKDSWMALLFTAVFSVLPVIMDLVIWQHINGYLVALILMFLSIRKCLLFLHQQISFKKMMVVNSLMLTIASLFCEFTIIFILGLIIYLWGTWPQNRQGKKWILALFVPIIVFFVLNIANWLAIYYSNLPLQKSYVIQGSFLTRGLVSVPVVFLRWLSFGAFPFQIEFYFQDGRYTIDTFSKFHPLTVLNIVLIIKGFFVLKRSRELLKDKGELKILLFLFVGLIFILCLTFSVLRVGPRSISYLKQSLYWAYFFWAFLITTLYILISQDRLTTFSQWSLSNKTMAAICLLLTFCYGWIDFGILQKRAIHDRSTRQLIASIEQSRRNVTDDSLDFKPFMKDPGNRKYKFFGDRSLIEMLYPSASY